MENLGIIILIIFAVLFVLALIFLKPKEPEWKDSARKSLNKLIHRQSTTDHKLLLLEADKLLDFCLEHKGVEGDTLGDRLKKSKRFFPWKQYQQIWEAHKARNQMVHDIDFQVNQNELQEHYEVLKKSIKQLIG